MLFEDVFVSLPIFDKYFIITGDFNSRTGEIDKIVKELEEYKEVFDDFDLPRKSRDKEVTVFGRRLIEFCKIYSIYIANGRIGNDKNIGNFTCIGLQGCSVIDYLMMSADLFNKTVNFDTENRRESTHFPPVLTMKGEGSPYDNYHDHLPLDAETQFSYSRKPADIDIFVQNILYSKPKIFSHYIQTLKIMISI